VAVAAIDCRQEEEVLMMARMPLLSGGGVFLMPLKCLFRGDPTPTASDADKLCA